MECQPFILFALQAWKPYDECQDKGLFLSFVWGNRRLCVDFSLGDALVEAGDAEADDGATVTDDDAAGIGCGNGVQVGDASDIFVAPS